MECCSRGWLQAALSVWKVVGYGGEVEVSATEGGCPTGVYTDNAVLAELPREPLNPEDRGTGVASRTCVQ